MNKDLDQAREWTKLAVAHETSEVARAAASVIQSLPDEWIDAAKLRDVIERTPTDPQSTALDPLIKDLRALLPASQPRTLADMTTEEREACQWMQAISDPDSGYTSGTVVIAQVKDDRAVIMWDDGSFDTRYHQHITPLPDLPRMVWPGSHADTITAESVEDMQAGRVADFEPAMPRPEDVPEEELWLVEVDGQQDAAQRELPGTKYPWWLMRGWSVSDEEVTLVSRLVPEVEA